MKQLLLLLALLPLHLFGLDRTILAFYNSDDLFSGQEQSNLAHKVAELPLNYLGAVLRLHDLAKGVPAEEEMEGVFGLLSFCTRPEMREAAAFCNWLTEQVKGGKRLVLLGEIPFLIDRETLQRTPLTTVNQLLQLIGLELTNSSTDDARQIEIGALDPEMMGFERPIYTKDIDKYIGINSLDKANRVYLTLKRRDRPKESSDAVVTTARGGYAQLDCCLYIEPNIRQMRWFIDPFTFFERAFDLAKRPRYDTTTLCGRRLFFSQIDGDGLRNSSLVNRFKESGEVIFREILLNYSIPITASFITCEVDHTLFGNRHIIHLAKQIFSLDHVEPAVHGFSHPLDWERKITVFAIPDYSVTINLNSGIGEELLSESAYSKGALIIVPFNEYLKKETVDAAQFLNRTIALPEKPVRVNLWTGNCLPPEKAVALVRGAGLRNMNGGDGRFDRAYPTYTALAPTVRHVGQERQIYTANANETIYTNGWTGPFYGQIYVIETYKQTEYPTLIGAAPRRVAPMNLYYHYYAGERKESLDALKAVYDYVLKSHPIPLFVSEYCDLVEGFYSGTIDEIEGGGWHFRGYGACQTVRFDGESRLPDLTRSKGIVGFNRWEGSLYLHLAPEGEATLYLTDAEPTVPYLVDASAPLSQIAFTDEGITFATRAFGSAEFRFAKLPPESDYLVEIEGAGASARRNVKSSSSGELLLELPIRSTATVRVTPID